MKPITTVILFIILFTTKGWTQNSLSGKIIDTKTKETLAGVGIYIPDLKTGTVTDKEGNYKINDLPKTKLLVRVTFIGYAGITQTIDLSTTSTQNFEMEETVTEMNEIVITGTAHSTELK